MKFSIIDWITLGFYFLVLAALGVYFSFKQKSATQYFLAGRNTRWYAIGTSVFAANISSEHLIGLAGSGATAGLAVGGYEWMAAFCLFILAWVFLPKYIKSKVFTIPEFLERRFNPHCRWYITIISIISYIFTKISVALFAGAIVLKYTVGWNYMTSAFILVIATGIYTMAGGLAAVIYADILQTTVIIAGSALLTIIGLVKVNGFVGLRESLPSGFFDMVYPSSHNVYPWTGMIFGILIIGIWYWATDQYIVQKTLSARNLNQARAGANFTAALKILPVFIFVLPGLIARSLWPVEVEASPDIAYPMMLTRLLPSGFSGLIMAAVLAAIISSLSAVFNSISTLFTMDIYLKLKPAAEDKELVLMGRIFIVVIVIIGVIWIPLIRHLSNQIYQYLQSVQSYISPPITAVFLTGILWRKTSGKAAFITLITGGILGALRFILDIFAKSLDVSWLKGFVELSFLNYSIIMFIICLILIISLSYILPETSSVKKSEDLIIRKGELGEGKISTWTIVNIGFSVVVGITIIMLWIHFS
jgi:SSS family solute:Na+ symporter